MIRVFFCRDILIYSFFLDAADIWPVTLKGQARYQGNKALRLISENAAGLRVLEELAGIKVRRRNIAIRSLYPKMNKISRLGDEAASLLSACNPIISLNSPIHQTTTSSGYCSSSLSRVTVRPQRAYTCKSRPVPVVVSCHLGTMHEIGSHRDGTTGPVPSQGERHPTLCPASTVYMGAFLCRGVCILRRGCFSTALSQPVSCCHWGTGQLMKRGRSQEDGMACPSHEVSMPGWRMYASLVMSVCTTFCTTVSDLEVIITHASRRKCENKITENCPVCVDAMKAWCATCMPVRRLDTPGCFGEQAHSSIDVGVLVLE